MPLDISKLDPTTLSLSPSDPAGRARDHFVEIYDEESDLIQSLTRFVNLGLRAGEVVIVVATEEHREALELGIDELETARARGMYRPVDAAELLETIMDHGIPRAEAFDSAVGSLIEAAGGGGRKVRVYGEMVALLWGRGDVGAALALEDLWNDLAERHPFRLFCSYPASEFEGETKTHLRAVCHRHSHVIAAPRN